MTEDAVLEINNIEVIYNRAVQVLHGLSLDVPRGAIVALLYNLSVKITGGLLVGFTNQ